MRKALLILFPMLVLCFGYTLLAKKEHVVTNNELVTERLNQQVKTVATFISKKPKYNQDIAFFVDMKIMSGKNRFFIYDFQKKEIVDKGLVAHGSGSETGNEGKLTFSNTNNSYCTSLGKYSIGEKYSGQFGLAYKLTGLDKTNNNARSRSIVLHKFSQVPYDEQEQAICNSLGCPMVNKIYFERIQKIIDTSKKPIILTIYY